MKRSLIVGALLIACLFLVSFVTGARNADYGAVNNQPVSTARLVYYSTTPEVASALEAAEPPTIKEVEEVYHGIEEKTEVVHYTEEEVIMVAKVLYRECRGIPSTTEATVWIATSLQAIRLRKL